MSKQLDELTKSLLQFYTNGLDEKQQVEMIQALEVLAADQKYNKFQNFFPEAGQYRRELYRKHIDFFQAGARYKQRGFIAAPRQGWVRVSPHFYVSPEEIDRFLDEGL